MHFCSAWSVRMVMMCTRLGSVSEFGPVASERFCSAISARILASASRLTQVD
jgi:hypothetical protein